MTEGAIRFDVAGTPAPKGSSRAMLTKTGHAVNVPSGSGVNRKRLKSWDVNVRDAASDVLSAGAMRPAEGPLFVGQPIAVELVFRLARPAGHWGKKGLRPRAPAWPAVKPDIDKLARATIDSLTGILFDDDSRIVTLLVQKEFAIPGQEGATILVALHSAFRQNGHD
jgi:Holliday junction resolvase RusA-like endonuclease